MSSLEAPRERLNRADREVVEALLGTPIGNAEPGVVVAIRKSGAVVFEAAIGSRRAGAREQLSPNTVFNVASLSKQFTAHAVLMLVEHGILALDEPAERYVPELSSLLAGTTFRHLLNLTDGIADYTALLLAIGYRLDQPVGRDETLEALAREGYRESPAGARFAYGNTGYFLLSVVIERVTGATLREVLARTIFRPLKMASSSVVDRYPSEVGNFAPGHRRKLGEFEPYACLWEQTGDGQVHTSIRDYFAWDARLSDTGATIFRQFARRPALLADGSRSPYGAGYFVEQAGATTQLVHHGAWAGYGAFCLHRPEERSCVAVFANRSDLKLEALARRLADLYLDGPEASDAA